MDVVNTETLSEITANNDYNGVGIMGKSTDFITAHSISEAMWLLRDIEKPWGRGDNANYVSAIIPKGYAAYSRVFHPSQNTTTKQEVTWTEAAKYYNGKVHSQMQWNTITNKESSVFENHQFMEPDKGRLSEKLAGVLIETLREFTQTPNDCWFAVWDGWGTNYKDQWPNAARLELPYRTYILLQGPLDAAKKSVDPFFQQSASLWWPQDRAWFVATDIDMLSTYVGGSITCINKVISDSRLEALLATLDDRVDFQGDEINILRS